jgi:hypothetical protein
MLGGFNNEVQRQWRCCEELGIFLNSNVVAVAGDVTSSVRRRAVQNPPRLETAWSMALSVHPFPAIVPDT